MLFGLCKCWSCLRGEQEDKMINVCQRDTASLTRKFSWRAGGWPLLVLFSKGRTVPECTFCKPQLLLSGKSYKHFQRFYLFWCQGFNHNLVDVSVADGDLSSRWVTVVVFSAQELCSSALLHYYRVMLFSLEVDLPDEHHKAFEWLHHTHTHTEASPAVLSSNPSEIPAFPRTLLSSSFCCSNTLCI